MHVRTFGILVVRCEMLYVKRINSTSFNPQEKYTSFTYGLEQIMSYPVNKYGNNWYNGKAIHVTGREGP
jgi:hypothetical protein